MNEFQKKYLLKRQDYGILYPYVAADSVTDINWNGKQLWVDDLEKGRYMASEVLSDGFIERFMLLLSNVANIPFNRMNPVLEAETEELRISIVHPSVAHTGATISIRKTPAVRRLEKTQMIQSGYCTEEMYHFFVNCIRAHCSIVICGLPGAGKTEFLKLLTKFIPAAERVVTIEDVLEIHYQKINPNKDCVEMKVAESFSYPDAIKACLRQLPKWIILSETKSIEVRPLLESLRTGAAGITTIHAEDVKDIPERVKNMAGEEEDLSGIENDAYRFLNVGVLIKSVVNTAGEIQRRVEQIGIFNRYGRGWKESVNEIVMMVENGQMTGHRIPDNVMRKFETAGIKNPLGKPI